MMKQKLSLLAVLALASFSNAQDGELAKLAYPTGVSRIEASGPMLFSQLDLDSGRISSSTQPVGSNQKRNPSFLCYDNSVDQNDTGPLGNVFDALLFPEDDELFDWGLKFCGGSTFVDQITIGYASMAINPLLGGPGGSLTLRVFAGGQGFGSRGIELASITLDGLPSSGNTNPLIPQSLVIDLGSQAFYLPEGPIAWSYQNEDGLTAPLLVDVTLASGTQNFFDLYRLSRFGSKQYSGTFTLPPGGFSFDPLENSFWIQINQRDELATVSSLPAGTNPSVLSSNQTPIVGQAWTALVDLSAFPSATRSFAVVSSQQLPGQMTGAGTLLLDLARVVVPMSSSTSGTHVFAIPMDASLVGMDFFIQAAVELAGVKYQLTNGLAMNVGTL